jgi:large subunit ribosomal protein L24
MVAMRKIRQGDEVIVVTGKDKGKRGKVIKLVDAGQRVVVENINLVKRHVRGNPAKGTAGSIMDKEMPLDISNILLFNPVTGKGDRVGFKILENGNKVRVFKSNKEVADI